MATLTIRKLDDAVYERLKREAAENHRSLEAEARAQLQRSFDLDAWVERQRETVQEMRLRYDDPREDSVATIRAVRDGE